VFAEGLASWRLAIALMLYTGYDKPTEEQREPSISRILGLCPFRADRAVGVAAGPEESTMSLRS
jgi:hypothetical protein